VASDLQTVSGKCHREAASLDDSIVALRTQDVQASLAINRPSVARMAKRDRDLRPKLKAFLVSTNRNDPL
jgi:hypothetical protein